MYAVKFRLDVWARENIFHAYRYHCSHVASGLFQTFVVKTICKIEMIFKKKYMPLYNRKRKEIFMRIFLYQKNCPNKNLAYIIPHPPSPHKGDRGCGMATIKDRLYTAKRDKNRIISPTDIFQNVGSVHFIVDTLERGFDATVPEFTEINIFILWILNTMCFIFSKFFLRIFM